ncbi:MAG: PP2C family protein-serine/threonine phosphatase [Acidobacteriota bacterium]
MSARLPRVSLFGGLALLAAGLAAAFAVLPEWRAVPPRPMNAVDAARTAVKGAGATLTKAKLVFSARPNLTSDFERAYRRLGSGARSYLETTGGAFAWTVRGVATVPGGGIGAAEVAFSPDGSIQAVDWSPEGSIFEGPDEKTRVARRAFAAKLEDLVRGGRTKAGDELTFPATNVMVRVQPLEAAPGAPAENVQTLESGGIKLSVSRRLRDPEAPQHFNAQGLARRLYRFIPSFVVFFAVGVAFGLLLYRRRLGFRIAVFLTALALVYEVIAGMSGEELPAGGFVAFALGLRAFSLLYLLALWAVAESLLRDTVPGFTTSLDSFVARRLGPRGGVAILSGLGAGAATIGITLLAFAAAALAAPHGAWPTGPSFAYPLFQTQKAPFYEGTFDAALFVLFVALLRFVLPRRWAGTAGALLFALYLSSATPLAPWGAGLALCLLYALVFRSVFDAHGLAALLVAAVSSALLRDALVACRALDGNALAALATVLPLAAIAAAGVIGWMRPDSEEEGRIDAPEYVRRLESERRVKYEMDLLSRMQLSLLPERPPVVEGLDLAVKTVLATEAGGDLFDFVIDDAGSLWIAAGDVSGHGYSCGIQQAMVMAALASLVKAGRKPSEILVEIDRVLRMGRSGRLFTSVALLSLDPKTGKGLLANAGHPYPLLLDEGVCREITGSGLPLGQGPKRTYDDITVEIPRGGVLILASDGLYEGPDLVDAPYGYDRPRDVLTAASLWRRPADAIVEALFADWRRHVGEGTPADDTTILVIKRPLF